MNISTKVEALVFDCDGVLLDTVKAKVASFRRWVPEEHAHLRDDFNRYNLAAFGQTRRVQLRYFYEVMLRREITPEFFEAEVERFAKINLETVRQASWLPGSREFVRQEHARGVPLYVLSGTPELELRDLLGYHGASNLFRGIIGSPTSKVTGLREIGAALGVPLSSVWFVGDATHDYASAREAGTGFVYKPSEAIFQADTQVTPVYSLMEISHE